jgi:hypothetical protein
MASAREQQTRWTRHLVTVTNFCNSDATKIYKDAKMEYLLSQVVWTPYTLLVVWILEFRLPVVGIGTLLQRMSDVRKQLVALSSSSLTTQWQYLHNGANWEEMTGIRVFLNSPKHSAVAILFLKYNLLVSEDMADKWSRVFRAASVGHSMIVKNEALRAVRKARVETVKAERLANWVADREALKAVIQSLKAGKKSLKADKRSLEADNKSLEHALHRSEAECEALRDECEALKAALRRSEAECEALEAQDNSLQIIII